jgi:hypothetical protein
VLLASGLTLGFFALLGFAAPSPQGNSGVSQLRQLGRGIQLYTADANGTCPLAMIKEPNINRWQWNRSIEAPAGVRRDTPPEVAEAFRSAWVNSVLPYWPNKDLLKIEGAPTAEPRLRLEDTVKDPWLVGFNYNGLLHAYSSQAVAHPELVPLIWTGQGFANREGLVNAMPTLTCEMWLQGNEPCKFGTGQQFSQKAAMFMQMGPAKVFDGAIVLAMADGSVRRLIPDGETNMTSDDPWAMYDRRGHGMSYKQVDGYPPLFRPDRAPKN